MAGNYPDAPSWRMAWDRDGTQLLWTPNSTSIPGDQTTATMVALNDESSSGITLGNNVYGYLTVMFPELRDLDAVYLRVSGAAPVVSVSADTTNGVDGTWATIATAGFTTGSVIKPSYRTGIGSSTSLGIRSVRFYIGNSGLGTNLLDVFALHLYGEIIPDQNPNRLDFWHATEDHRLGPAALDWGDVPRSSSADKSFRVKNLSGSLTAGAIRVAMEALTDAVPSVPAQHTLSYNGGPFLPQVNVGDLAPGAVSGVVTIRRITPSNAVLSLWSMRVFAEPGSWA